MRSTLPFISYPIVYVVFYVVFCILCHSLCTIQSFQISVDVADVFSSKEKGSLLVISFLWSKVTQLDVKYGELSLFFLGMIQRKWFI